MKVANPVLEHRGSRHRIRWRRIVAQPFACGEDLRPQADLVIDLQQIPRVTSVQTALVKVEEIDASADEGDWVRLRDRTGICVAVGFVAERIGDRGLCVIQPKIVFAS